MTPVQTARREQILNPVRQFNKWVYNPLVLLTIAGRRVYAIIWHLGRRSGRIYTTPVVAEPVGDSFFVPLPYGVNVDWRQNIQAAGRCVVRWRGAAYLVGAPEIVAAAEALPVFPALMQRSFRFFKIAQFLKLKRLDG